MEREHKTFPRSGNRKRLLEEILKNFKNNTLNILNYKNLLKYEGIFKNPKTIKFKKTKANKYF